MDVQLPGHRRRRGARGGCGRDPAHGAMRVVALTAFAMKDDRERLLAAGFDGYLVKPITCGVPGAGRGAAGRTCGGEA